LKLRQGGVGLFYFAGHGVQVGGRNYLIPISAEINAETEVEYEAVEAGFVLAQMEEARNRLNIVILDACRNNPFARSFRSSTRGPAGVRSAPSGTLIAYATAADDVAADGAGRNGLFTGELLAQIKTPGLTLAQVFQRTRTSVRLPTEAEWEYTVRAGATTPFAFGPTIMPQIVNYHANFPYGAAPKGSYRQQTVPVGSLGVANVFGLFELHGNVWEWCQDVWHENYSGAPTDGSAWLSGGDSRSRVLRGGSWNLNARNCRSANRISHFKAAGNLYAEVRCALQRLNGCAHIFFDVAEALAQTFDALLEGVSQDDFIARRVLVASWP
jgi:hypothetical protein